MTEDFLYYVWQFRQYETPVYTVEGEEITVISPGTRNVDSGPDFFNCKLKIGETIWAGNVEIHVNATDWFKHKHQYDDLFATIILHVVYDNDLPESVETGSVPVLVLKDRIKVNAMGKYNILMKSRTWIPCESMIADVDPFTIRTWMERLLVDRFQYKSEEILHLFHHSGNDWNASFYASLATGMGFKVNKEAFTTLSRMLPLQILLKHIDDLFQIEALLYGTSGLLDEDFRDEYPLALKKEFKFLAGKYNLRKMDRMNWKYMRLRPGNFPTIRIAQFAMLLFKLNGELIRLTEQEGFSELKILQEISTSAYWETHYVFDKKTEVKIKHLGADSIDLLVVNVIAPFIFTYSRSRGDHEKAEKALELLARIEPEKNNIINGWKQLGIMAKNAAESQALIGLKNHFCEQKKCLNCAIGNFLLNR